MNYPLGEYIKKRTTISYGIILYRKGRFTSKINEKYPQALQNTSI